MTPHLNLCPQPKRARGRKLSHVTRPPQPFLQRQLSPPISYFLAPPPDGEDWQEAVPARIGLEYYHNSLLFQQRFAGSFQRRCGSLPPGCQPRDRARLGQAAGGLHYSSPRTPPARHPPRRVTTRLSRCLALSPAHLCPRPFRPSLPLRPSLRGSGGGGGSRSSLARYIKGRSRRTGRLELQPVAAAAA